MRTDELFLIRLHPPDRRYQRTRFLYSSTELPAQIALSTPKTFFSKNEGSRRTQIGRMRTDELFLIRLHPPDRRYQRTRFLYSSTELPAQIALSTPKTFFSKNEGSRRTQIGRMRTDELFLIRLHPPDRRYQRTRFLYSSTELPAQIALSTPKTFFSKNEGSRRTQIGRIRTDELFLIRLHPPDRRYPRTRFLFSKQLSSPYFTNGTTKNSASGKFFAT